MNTVFYNGVIKTMDNAYPEVSAIWVKDGVILRVGSDEEILAVAGEEAKKVDLGGKLALPGFCDTHMHMLFYGSLLQRIDMTEAKTWEECKGWMAADVEAARAEGRWVLGRSFNQDYWSDTNKMPDRHDLDAIAEDVPIALVRACGHIACCNTKALELCGLWNETPDTKETMDFGADGKPNGYVRENTTAILTKEFATYDLAQTKALLKQATQNAVKKGIVQAHTDDFNLLVEGDLKQNLQAYKELVEEGELPIRIYEQIRFQNSDQLKEFFDMGYKMKDTLGRFKFGPIKLLNDGSLGAHSAAMREE